MKTVMLYHAFTICSLCLWYAAGQKYTQLPPDTKFHACRGLNKMNPVLMAQETARVSSMFSKCGAKLYVQHKPNWKTFHYLLHSFCYAAAVCFNYLGDMPNHIPKTIMKNATSYALLTEHLTLILLDNSLRKVKCIRHGTVRVCMNRAETREFINAITRCYVSATGYTLPGYAEQMFFALKYIVEHVL